MQDITNDFTLKRNQLSRYRFLMKEYEQVKKGGGHVLYRFAKDFYLAHNTDPRSFLKYYTLFKQSGNELDLLQQKRRPKYGKRRPDADQERQELELRERGCNKFEIASQLKQKSNNFTPSPSSVYNILKRHNRNRLKQAEREEKVKIIKERMGQLGHIDCHHLSKNVIRGQTGGFACSVSWMITRVWPGHR